MPPILGLLRSAREDRGVDGLLYFYESKDERRKMIVQVKGGGVKHGDVAIPPWPHDFPLTRR